jgi:predicted nucleic acid-binding Zn ribbon protein
MTPTSLSGLTRFSPRQAKSYIPIPGLVAIFLWKHPKIYFSWNSEENIEFRKNKNSTKTTHILEEGRSGRKCAFCPSIIHSYGYCCRTCYFSIRRSVVEVECLECHKHKLMRLSLYLNRQKNYPGKTFCSNHCHMIWRERPRKRKCEICGNLAMKQRKFCSERCYKEHWKRKSFKNPSRQCAGCGKWFWHSNRIKMTCSWICKNMVHSRLMRTSKNVWYIHGLMDPSKFYEGLFHKLKRYVIERDRGRCFKCKKFPKGKQRHVHHIDEDKNNNRFGNLILLCGGCHVYGHKRKCHDSAAMHRAALFRIRTAKAAWLRLVKSDLTNYMAFSIYGSGRRGRPPAWRP